MTRWTVLGIGILTGLHVVAGAAVAQTATQPGTTSSISTPTSTTTGAFEQLSPGNQKIARALFEAQQTETTTTGTTGTGTATGGTATKPLTLDEIAAKKQSGTGWGEVFKQMKTQGLVQDKNLGQAVSRYNHQHKSGGVVTTASGKTFSKSHHSGKESDGDHDKSGAVSGDHDKSGVVSGSGHGYGNGSGHGRSAGSGPGAGHGRGK